LSFLQVVDWRDCWTAAKETKLPLVIKAGGQPGTPNGWILAGFDMRPREEGAIDLEIVVLHSSWKQGDTVWAWSACAELTAGLVGIDILDP
jgi:hypothetical protein